MKRSEQVHQASIVPIGGCEDEAKDRVSRLFRKKKYSVNYSNMTTCEINMIDDRYTVDCIRYSYLVNKQALHLFTGSRFSKSEEIELNIYTSRYGEINFSYYFSLYVPMLIELSNAAINAISVVLNGAKLLVYNGINRSIKLSILYICFLNTILISLNIIVAHIQYMTGENDNSPPMYYSSIKTLKFNSSVKRIFFGKW